MKNHIVLCGLDHVGYRISELLCRLREDVVVITDKTRPEWKDRLEQKGIKVLMGDASDERMLAQAGVREAKAIIIATDNDMANLSMAIDAKRLNPALSIVLRLFDHHLAQHLKQIFNAGHVLSTSALSAQAFVSALLDQTILGSFGEGEKRRVIAKVVVDERAPIAGKTVSEVVRQFAVQLLSLRHSGPLMFDPAASSVIRTGDEVTVMGHPNDFKRMAPFTKIGREAGYSKTIRSGDTARSFISVARDVLHHHWKETSRAVKFVVGILVFVVFLSVVVFHLGLKLSWLDAVYFVVTVITTVGLGDINLLHASPWMKLYGVLMMTAGAAFITTLWALITDFIIKARFDDIIGKKRIPVGGHIIVFGLGHLGYRVVNDLIKAGEKVVAIEKSVGSEFLESMQEQTPIVFADGDLEAALGRASARTAKALMATSDDDIKNLSIGLMARHCNPSCRLTLRIFDGDLAAKLQNSLPNASILSTSALSAPAFVGAALSQSFRHAVVLENNLILITGAGPEDETQDEKLAMFSMNLS